MKHFKLIIILIILIPINYCYAEDFNITSKNVILYNLNDDKVLYEQKADEKVQIASLTKIMSALVAIEENEDLNKEVTITKEVLDGIYEYSQVGLKAGNVVTIKDLLYGTLLSSGADAVNALAIETGGSVDNFVTLMNNKAKALKLKNTSFDNPIGMDGEKNYSTAQDIATLLKYSLENETFKEIFTTREYLIPAINIKAKSTLTTYSRGYGINADIITGAKSGFTDEAGLCLASISTIDDVNYLLVTMGADTKNKSNAVRDSLEIYDYYSSNYSYQTIVEKDKLVKTLPVKWGKTKTYDIIIKENKDMYLENNIRKNKLKVKYDGIEELNYKIKKGDKIGTATVSYRDKELATYDIYLDEDIKYYHPLIYTVIAIAVIIMIISLKNIIKPKHKKINTLAPKKNKKKKHK